MLVAIIADTHLPRGARRIPDACVEHMRRADLIVHAGDFTAAEVLAELEAVGPPLVAVHGNVDSAKVVERLPVRTEVEIEGARLAVIHDAGPRRGRLARLRRAFPDADAVVFGHSHMALHEQDGQFQIFNPGSPTERRRAPHRSMGLAFVEAGRISFEHVILD
jgi:putative phosphoesterase